MWGLVFVGPLLLPEYPALLQTFGRYLAFGLVALPLAWLDRRALRALCRADWIAAVKLSLVGNLLYYFCLASAIQRAGAPLPTMIIGTLPVVISVVANRLNHARDGRLPWAKLLPALGIILVGLGCVNHAEMRALALQPQADYWRYGTGAALALGALVCWTWYPIKNANWLRDHPNRNPRVWATAQGLVTLPLAVVGYGLVWVAAGALGVDFGFSPGAAVEGAAGTVHGAQHGFEMPFGPRPADFIGLMVAIGLFASWLGTLCWNEASQRLPTNVAGQLIVFETLAALAYAFALRGNWPEPLTGIGIALLILGVVLAANISRQNETTPAKG